MRGHPGGLTDRLARVGRRQTTLIQGMSGLMHHGQDGGGEIVLQIAGRDPDIGGRSAGERMGRLIEPGMVEIKAQPLRQVAAKRLLGRDRKRSGGSDRGWLFGLQLFDKRQSGGQEILIGGEDRRHVVGTNALLVAVHQGVVRAETECLRQPGGGFAGQAQHLGQMRSHYGEVGVLTGGPPHFLAVGVRLRLRLHQILRQRLGSGVGVAHQAQVGGFPRIGCFGSREVGLDFRCGQVLMPQHRQHRQLVATSRTAARRHDGGGVPPQHGGTLTDRGDQPETGGQTFVRGGMCHDRNAFRTQTPNMMSSATARPYQVTT
jgi:hypothetical protein